MTTVQKSRKTSRTEKETENNNSNGNGRADSNVSDNRRINFVNCANYKAGDPVFNVLGNITGMSDKRSPVSNMKMYYQSRKNAPPQLDFDIDLTKEAGEDERYVLTNEPSAEEKEQRMQVKLCRLEKDLQELRNQLEFVKGLRREWNAQKAGLCNRRFKDNPICYSSDFEKTE